MAVAARATEQFVGRIVKAEGTRHLAAGRPVWAVMVSEPQTAGSSEAGPVRLAGEAASVFLAVVEE